MILAGSLALAAALWAPAFTGSSAASEPAVSIAGKGGFFVGGEVVRLRDVPKRQRVRAEGMAAEAVDVNGDYLKGAVYIEYTRLARPRHRLPIVMFPGGGFSAASFQDTPDGRPGWEWSFLKRGYSVYLADIHRTGRSPWRRFPDVETEEPSFRSNQFLWETFRIGPPRSYEKRRPYPDTLFPVEHFAELAKQAAPRFRLPAEEEAAAYDAIIKRLCPCVILLHSAAGPPGMAAAQRWPKLVRAVVSVEPSGGPANSTIASGAPHIFLWGDHLEPADTLSSWAELHDKSRTFQRALSQKGVQTRWIDLPALNIRGNSHFPMLDSNSEEIADLIDRALIEFEGDDSVGD